MNKSWLIRGAAQYYRKTKEETVGKKEGLKLGQLPTSLAALTGQFRERKAYLHLILNLAKSYKQETSSNYTHSVMET